MGTIKFLLNKLISKYSFRLPLISTKISIGIYKTRTLNFQSWKL